MQDILKATSGRLVQGPPDALFQNLSTDSRTVNKGDLFVALKGARFDGHDYALEALRKEAGGAVLDEQRVREFNWNGYRSRAVISVTNTLQALGDLAQSQRRKYRTPVIAITGSNGKTSTKEMVARCLETRLPVLKSEGNFNNLIGLPLTLLGLTGKERAVVVEMGTNIPGEIRRLTEIAQPDIGLITNIQKVHLKGMGSLERLVEEKGELFRKMKQGGTIAVNADDPRVVSLAEGFPGAKRTFGIQSPADIMAKDIQLRETGTSFTVVTEKEEIPMILPVIGVHFVLNALAAVAVGSLFGIPVSKAGEALGMLPPFPMRMEIESLGGGRTLINDAYNANPRSMELALETLAAIKGQGRAIAVLGDMFELGSFSDEAHRDLGRKTSELPIDALIALGAHAATVVESAIRHGFHPERATVAGSHGEAISMLERMAEEGDWILVKGSRGMAMEKIAEGLRRRRS